MTSTGWVVIICVCVPIVMLGVIICVGLLADASVWKGKASAAEHRYNELRASFEATLGAIENKITDMASEQRVTAMRLRDLAQDVEAVRDFSALAALATHATTPEADEAKPSGTPPGVVGVVDTPPL